MRGIDEQRVLDIIADLDAATAGMTDEEQADFYTALADHFTARATALAARLRKKLQQSADYWP